MTGVFVASRLALLAAGFRFDFSLDWMWLSDPADLQSRLLETIYYFHAFPPGMAVLTGVLLKAGGAYAAPLALLVFWGLGLLLVTTLFHLCRVSGLSFPVAFAVSTAFSLAPPSLYFEHLYLYEEPVAALLVLSIALFHAGLRRGTFAIWLAFFTVCAVIGVIRSTFHLAWFAVMFAAAAGASRPAARRQVWRAALVPALLLSALYVKNLVVFGTFGALTYGPSSYAHVTVSRLPPEVKRDWIARGYISPFAGLSPYAGPRDYARFFPAGVPAGLPSQLTQLDRPTVHAPNFNHWFILEGNRRRGPDAWFYVTHRPLEYLSNALVGLRDLFAPSTLWHPATGTTRSPHNRHRAVLGGWEHAYNRLLHSVPVAPVGLYVALPFVLWWTLAFARRSWRSGEELAWAAGATLALCVLQVVFVVAVSSAFTFLESSRYRYQVEPLIWLMTAVCLAHTMRKSLAPALRL